MRHSEEKLKAAILLIAKEFGKIYFFNNLYKIRFPIEKIISSIAHLMFVKAFDPTNFDQEFFDAYFIIQECAQDLYEQEN